MHVISKLKYLRFLELTLLLFSEWPLILYCYPFVHTHQLLFSCTK